MRYWTKVALGTAFAGIVAACGSTGDGSLFVDHSADGTGAEAGLDGTTPTPGFPGDDSGTGFTPGPMTCTPQTCVSAGVNCGPFANGCGGVLDCGSCTAHSL